MRVSSLDLIVIGGYFLGLALFGLLVRRVRGFSDYSVASRKAPFSMIMASLCATYIGPGYTMGLTGRAYTSGYLFPVLFLFFSLQTVLVGLVVAPRLQRMKEAHSLGDVMSALYSRETQIVTGLLSVGLCAGFAAVMARAGGAVISGVLSVPLWVGVLLITAVGVVYTFTGGLKSVIATEAIQFTIMTLGIAVMVLVTRGHLSASDLSVTSPALATPASSVAPSWFSLVGLALSFLLGETLIPPYANRALASKSESASRRGFVCAGTFSVIWFGMVTSLGFMAQKVLGGEVAEDEVFVALAFKILPEGLFGLVIVAIAAIVMSSQESVLNAGAVAFTRDVLPRSLRLSDKGSLLLSRVLTLFLGAGAVVISLFAPSVMDGLLICYAVWAPSVLPALLWGILGFPTRPLPGLLSICAGALGSGALVLLGVGPSNSGTALLGGLTCALAGALLGLVIDRLRR